LFNKAPPGKPEPYIAGRLLFFKATLKKSQALGDTQGRAGDVQLENESSFQGIMAIVEQGCVRSHYY
jgi:hypothetical protein